MNEPNDGSPRQRRIYSQAVIPRLGYEEEQIQNRYNLRRDLIKSALQGLCSNTSNNLRNQYEIAAAAIAIADAVMDRLEA